MPARDPHQPARFARRHLVGADGVPPISLGQYGAAAASARESVAAMPKHPFYALLLAASLVELDRRAEAEEIVRDYMARNPAFETATIATTLWPTGAAGHPSFAAGRDRIAATLRELGMP